MADEQAGMTVAQACAKALAEEQSEHAAELAEAEDDWAREAKAYQAERDAALRKLAMLLEPDEDFIEAVERRLPADCTHAHRVYLVARAIGEVLSDG